MTENINSNVEDFYIALEEFSKYKKNWDSYGAAKLPKNSIKYAYKFLDFISAYDDHFLKYLWINPFDGGVQFDVDVEDDESFFEIKFRKDCINLLLYPSETLNLKFRKFSYSIKTIHKYFSSVDYIFTSIIEEIKFNIAYAKLIK